MLLVRSSVSVALRGSNGSLKLLLRSPATNREKKFHKAAPAICKKQSTFRPSVDDVDRLSRGQGAKRRGTGSRDVPHRLNAEERTQFDIAKKKGFLVVKGTGYRRERKGSPLANIYRQWCDAKATPCVVVELQQQRSDGGGAGGGSGDEAQLLDRVVVDLSPLRMTGLTQVAHVAARVAHEAGAAPSNDVDTPFTALTTLLPPAIPNYPAAVTSPPPASGRSQPGSSGPSGRSTSDSSDQGSNAAAAAGAAIVSSMNREAAGQEQALAPPASASPSSPSSAEGGDDAALDVESVVDLIGTASGTQGQVSGGAGDSSDGEGNTDGGGAEGVAEEHNDLWNTAPIWQLPPVPLVFDCERSAAKDLARAVVAALPRV